jgi:hypothetical protein
MRGWKDRGCDDCVTGKHIELKYTERGRNKYGKDNRDNTILHTGVNNKAMEQRRGD